MFAELAFIDWLALIVAAILLSGAAASLVLVSVAARQRRRPMSSSSYPRALRAGPPVVSRSTNPGADVIDLRAPRHSSGVSRAARADRLRNRPEPDVGPPQDPDQSKSRGTIGSVLMLRHGRRARAHGFSPREPGFFEDPIGKHELRYWDGSRWTEHVKEHGQRFTDPL